MNRVIIISYQFPPYGGKAVQRASKLAKYLPYFEWQPIVFTMPVVKYGALIDRSLLDELPSGVEIHRPQYLDLWKLVPYDIRKYLYNPLPDTFRGWTNAVEPDVIKLIRHTGARALISTSPSHSAQLLGLAAKEKTGISWIADFRDQWTGHPDFAAKKNMDLIHEMEQRVLEKADAVVTSAPCTKRDFLKKVSDEKIFVIENGYDEQDFSLIDRTYTHNHHELRIGYNGTTRAIEDPSTLLKVVSELYQAGDITKDILTLTFTGSADIKLFKPFTELIDAEIVNISGYLPHPESLARLAEMDVSLLLLTKGCDIYPAKVFEYMYIGNPVFSLSTPGDELDRLITETGSGVVVDYRDKFAVRDELLRFIEMKKQGKLLRLSPGRKEISQFSRKIIAQRFAEILDRISC